MFVRVFVNIFGNSQMDDYHDHTSWAVGSEKELDIIHENGVTTTTYAEGTWRKVEKVLEDGETWEDVADDEAKR